MVPSRLERNDMKHLHSSAGKIKDDDLRYQPNEHRKLHPRRPKDWASFQAAKIASIAEPGLDHEAAMLEALSYERQSEDAKIWSEAIEAERVSWGRAR